MSPTGRDPGRATLAQLRQPLLGRKVFVIRLSETQQ
jgi:hypothetical protein